MVGQDEYLDASSSALFSPASDSSNHVDNALSTASRKRKRDGVAMENMLDDSFIIKPHPSTVFTKPRTLRPIALLHRSHLALSCINTNSSSNPLPESRLYEAHVKILELEERMGDKPMLIIARLDDGKTIYAVERDSRGLCVLCRLGSWVDLDKLCAEAIVSRHQVRISLGNGIGQAAHVETVPFESKTTSESSKYSKKKRLAIEAIQSMVKRPSATKSGNSQLPTTVEQNNPPDVPASIVEKDAIEPMEPYETEKQPDAAEILDNIRSQYLETLYLSKASLGYFAKGPLSRARAAFHLDYDSTLDMNDLVTFLESLILPTAVLDKKYKDGVPAVVSRLIIGEASDDEAEILAKGDPKKRKSKKMRLGKNGLYPAEDNYLRRWWAAYDDESELGVPGSSRDDVGKKRVAKLRIRETQLQMIVILETLALQPLATSQADQGGELPFGGVKDEACSRTKSKKSRDLPRLIDVHVDRLCIWQSLAIEEATGSSKSGSSGKNGGELSELEKAHRHAADVLREFCVELIIPFFSARLPDQCNTIRRKLGAPAVSPPATRQRLVKSASTSGVLSRPAMKRPAPVKPRRSLQRVLTDERQAKIGSRGPSGAIALMRSATAPIIPGLKREASESPSLSTIPAADTQNIRVSRGGVVDSKRFSQREVDLSNMITVMDAKTKKANIEAELREAITALKRPNRQLAGQIQVNSAEQRTSTTTSHSRKSKKPVRNPLFQGVQILATPKLNRRKDVETGILPKLSPDMGRDFDTTAVPASSVPRFIKSAAAFEPNSPGSLNICKVTQAQQRPERNSSSAVQGTPSRVTADSLFSNSFTSRNLGEYDIILPSSPLQPRNESKQHILSVPCPRTYGIENFRTPTRQSKIQATPVKQAMTSNVENEDPFQTVLSTPVPRGIKKNDTISTCNTEVKLANYDSIYKSLGWDDDLDDL